MIRFRLFLLLCLLSYASLMAQPFATGLNFDDAAYEDLPITATLMSRDYSLLPRAYSLKAYAPTPGSQGTTGTCTAWATAYHARTILESVKLGRTDRAEIDRHAFSVSYVYNQIRSSNGCDEGTWIWDALDLMQTRGVPRAGDFGFACDRPVSEADHRLAREFRIEGYKRLHSTNDQDKITPIKKCLTEDKPVVFCMHLPPSFYEARERWEPAAFEVRQPGAFGGHAMVIVGYDDARDGGSFEVMNSWGNTRWGNGGFTWVRYEDYKTFARYAFELIEGVKPGMNEVVLSAPDLGGDFALQLAAGDQMRVRYDAQAGMYRSQQGYPSGTLFRLIIGNKQPAYVYAFGSDLATQQIYPIFPHQPQVSPYLGYVNSHVAIPDEAHYVQMDQTRGRDYFCVLYSNKPLNIEAIMASMGREQGAFRERLMRVLGSKAVASRDIAYTPDQIGFSAFSKGAEVVPVVVEIEHL